MLREEETARTFSHECETPAVVTTQLFTNVPYCCVLPAVHIGNLTTTYMSSGLQHYRPPTTEVFGHGWDWRSAATAAYARRVWTLQISMSATAARLSESRLAMDFQQLCTFETFRQLWRHYGYGGNLQDVIDQEFPRIKGNCAY